MDADWIKRVILETLADGKYVTMADQFKALRAAGVNVSEVEWQNICERLGCNNDSEVRRGENWTRPTQVQ